MTAAAAQGAARARLVVVGEDRLLVEGALDFSTVMRLLAESESLLKRGRPLSIDLAGVDSANSAGAALLLEWVERAKAQRVELRYLNLPESLARIAAYSNLRKLLPVAESVG